MSEQTCKTCDGKGKVIIDGLMLTSNPPKFQSAECPDCKGLGTFAKAEYTPLAYQSEVDILKDRINEIDESLNDLIIYSPIERIEKLEESNAHVKIPYVFLERIEKLEFDVKNNSNSIGCVDSAYDEVTINLEKRIEKLEKKTNVLDSTRINLADFDKLQERIESLEKTPIYIVSDVMERIEKLEAHNTANIMTKVSAAQCFESVNLPGIKERIENLEKRAIVNGKDGVYYEVDNICNDIDKLQERIVKLETPQQGNYQKMAAFIKKIRDTNSIYGWHDEARILLLDVGETK